MTSDTANATIRISIGRILSARISCRPSNRSLQPVYSSFDTSFIYSNATQIVAVSLRSDVPSPTAPQNDEETVKEDKKPDDKKVDEKKDQVAGSDTSRQRHPRVPIKSRPRSRSRLNLTGSKHEPFCSLRKPVPTPDWTRRRARFCSYAGREAGRRRGQECSLLL